MKEWQISVSAFKPTGKWYAGGRTRGHTGEEPVLLKHEHREIAGFQLMDLIEANDPSVQDYSPVGSGFGGEFIFEIEVQYPDHKRDHCHRLLIPKFMRLRKITQGNLDSLVEVIREAGIVEDL